jgi:hypothetical protein
MSWLSYGCNLQGWIKEIGILYEFLKNKSEEVKDSLEKDGRRQRQSRKYG